MDTEEFYLRYYTTYGNFAYEDDEESAEEFDEMAYGEARWEAENGR